MSTAENRPVGPAGVLMPEKDNLQKEPARVLLSVKDLCMYFDSGGRRIKASEHVSFDIREGETFGLVGESGSGKSTIAKCIVGLNRSTSGSITFKGQDITNIRSRKEYREKLKEIQMIFQDPMSSLNPRKQVGVILREALEIQGIGKDRAEREQLAGEALQAVGIPLEYAGRYPSSFSGGQRQRIGIARALAGKPKLIIADECIAALDASVQAQIVNMLRRIKEETGASFLFISHDLSMVRYLSDRIGVLHLGYLLETGSSEEIFRDPVHPYTRGLLAAIPRMNPLLPQTETGRNDPASYGIDYGRGKWHKITDTHHVLCTDREYEKWRETAAAEVDNEHSK